MSEPREDANCLICEHKKFCRKAYDKEYNIDGKPFVKCYGYAKKMTEEDIKNSNWGNLK